MMANGDAAPYRQIIDDSSHPLAEVAQPAARLRNVPRFRGDEADPGDQSALGDALKALSCPIRSSCFDAKGP